MCSIGVTSPDGNLPCASAENITTEEAKDIRLVWFEWLKSAVKAEKAAQAMAEPHWVVFKQKLMTLEPHSD
jgi:hypothetical protein